jgi:hypothetical protein
MTKKFILHSDLVPEGNGDLRQEENSAATSAEGWLDIVQ